MFSTRPPADFRIQRMRAADEKSNQMQAYVKSWKTKEFGAVWEHNSNNMIARNQFKQRFEALKAQAEANVDARRRKLAAKLHAEELALQQELVANQVTPEERRAALEKRAVDLVRRREDERVEIGRASCRERV